MKRFAHWQWAIAVGGALMLCGCNEEESSTPAPKAPPVPEQIDVDDTAAAAEEHVEEAAATVEEKVEDAANEAEAEAAALIDQAQPLLDNAMKYLDENKFDLADKALTQLEGMEGLPASIMDQVKNARSMLDAKQNLDAASGAAEGLEGMMGK